MVYSRVLDINDSLVCDSLNDGNLSLEPGKFLEMLPKEILDLECPLVVRVSDGVESVEYTLSTFLSRSYRVVGKNVRFGSKKLKIANLSVSVGVKILLEDLTSMTEPVLD
jgi:hypothetical protein